MEFIYHFFDAGEIGIFADLVGQNGDEDVVADVEEEHDLDKVKKLGQHSEWGEYHGPIFIDAVLKVVEEILVVSEFEVFKLLWSVEAQHVEEDERSYKQDDVELNSEVGGDCLLEKEAEHQPIVRLSQVDYDFAPREEANDSIIPIEIAKECDETD